MTKRRGPRVRVGISGWRYPEWRGTFYPPGLAQRRELEFASRKMTTIEINGSFYSLQRPSSYVAWRDEVPEDFIFSVKGGRFITHNKKLRDCERPLANFFASGVLALGPKLGPILWQLPPQLPFDERRLDDFFAMLPRTTRDASRLAACHDTRLRHEPWLEIHDDRPLRHALEVRHDTFADPRFFDVMRKHGIAVCVADTAGKWPYLPVVTADFVYVRLHGHQQLYVSGYGAAELDSWAARIAAWAPRDVYVYFDNDVKSRAPFDAMNLAARLGYGKKVAFPRKALRAMEAARGAMEARTTWDRWKRPSSGARTAGRVEG